MKKILFLFILIFSLCSIIIHNNYSSTQNIVINSEIAEPIFNIATAKPIILDNSNTSVQYSFKISNFKDNTISEIPFNYYFYIENVPPNFLINCYMDSKEIAFANFKSEKFFINNLCKEEHIFTIFISYTGNFDSAIATNFNLKISYEQLKF